MAKSGLAPPSSPVHGRRGVAVGARERFLGMQEHGRAVVVTWRLPSCQLKAARKRENAWARTFAQAQVRSRRR